MSDRPDIPPEDGAQAAEYALGLLTGSDLSAFEARLKTDADLRREVAGWEAHFAEIAVDDVDPVTVPPSVETAVMAKLFDDSAPISIWTRLLGWRGIAAAAAIVLGIFLYMGPSPETGPQYHAQVVSEDGGLSLLAVLDGPVLHIHRSEGIVTPGRAQELWMFIGDAAPVSLGVLPDVAAGDIEISATHAQQFSGAVLAISDEPIGGSPTGLPTGAVLASGPVTEI